MCKQNKLFTILIMSYVIQNFSYTKPSLRSTMRTRAVILARNVPLIYTLLLKSARLMTLNAHSLKNVRFVFSLGNKEFKALSRVLFMKTKLLSYSPIGVNFPLSTHYSTLSNLNKLFSDKPTFENFPLSTYTKSFLYPYFDSPQIAITPFAKKPFWYALYKLLRASLNLWFCWPRHLIFTTHFTSIHSTWLLLKFLNKFFFKVYNL